MMHSPNRPSSLSISVYVLLGLSLLPTVPARAELIPRTPLPKRPYVLYPNDPSQMAIKFVDAMKARTQQGQLTADDQDMLDEVAPVIAQHNLLFTKLIQLPYVKLTNLEQRAATYSGKAQPDLGGMMVVHFPSSADELTVANDLLALDAVEYVINELLTIRLREDIPPTTPLLWGNQGYFGPDPGLDMDYAWSKASINGLFNTRAKGIKLTQVEDAWNLEHEDLVDQGVFVIREGEPFPGEVPIWHGTAVLGIMAADENAYAIAGHASEATIQVSGRTLLEGDINADGVVNPLDVGFVQARIDCPVGTGKIDCDASDRNLDGVVDAADVELVMAQFASERSHRGPSRGVEGGDCDVFAAFEVGLDLRNPLDGGAVIDTWVGRATELQIVLSTVYPGANVAFVYAFLDQNTLSGAADSLRIEALLPGLPEPWIYDRSAFTLPAAIDAPGENEYGLILGDNTKCGGLFGEFEQVLDTLVFIASSASEHEITFELGARAPGIFTLDFYQYVPCFGWLIPQYCIGVGDTDNPLIIHATVCDGDANRDGFINPLDSGFILARLGCVVGIGDAGCDMADVNGDGAVDPLDSAYVLARLGCNTPCPAYDCNDNGIEDSCDIESGFSEDCQDNNIPDECELDINGNGVPDECES